MYVPVIDCHLPIVPKLESNGTKQIMTRIYILKILVVLCLCPNVRLFCDFSNLFPARFPTEMWPADV